MKYLSDEELDKLVSEESAKMEPPDRSLMYERAIANAASDAGYKAGCEDTKKDLIHRLNKAEFWTPGELIEWLKA